MSIQSLLRVTVGVLIVSTSALQLSADLDSRLDIEAAGDDAANTWLSEAEANGKFGEALVRKMIETGAIQNRSSPDTPSRTQYALNWMSEQEVIRRFGGRKQVMQLVQEGKLQKRRSPTTPTRSQYLVSTSDAASKLSTRRAPTQEPHAKASEKHAKKTKTSLGAKALKKTKSAGGLRKTKESHANASHREEKKLKTAAGEKTHKKLEHTAAHEQPKEEKTIHKKSGDKAAKAMKHVTGHKRSSHSMEQESQGTHEEAGEAKPNAFDRMKGAASSVISKVGSIFQEKSHSPRHIAKEADSEVQLFSQKEPKEANETAEVQSGDAAHLPGVDVFMKKPSNVFQSLTQKIDALKASLAAKESENYAAVAALKAKFEANLSAVRHNVSAIHEKNRRIKRELSSLNSDNDRLRERATALTSRGEMLRHQLLALQQNITTAQEFITASLEVPDDEENSTAVLRELDAEESTHQAERAHEKALAAVRGASLLQVDGEGDVEDDAADNTLHTQTLSYVSQLGTNFEALDVEQASSEQSLTQKYEEDYAVEMDRQREALDTQARLSTQREAAQELQTRLQAAVDHLDSSVSKLRSRLDSLKMYVAKLGHA